MFDAKAARRQRLKNFFGMLATALLFDAIVFGMLLYAAYT